MMRITTVGSAFAFYSCLLVSACLMAEPQQKEKPAKVSGNIELLDTGKNYMILVTKEGKLITLELSRETKITKQPGSMKATIKDIQPGGAAEVTYTIKTGRSLAAAIELRPGGCPEGRPCPDDADKKAKKPK